MTAIKAESEGVGVKVFIQKGEIKRVAPSLGQFEVEV